MSQDDWGTWAKDFRSAPTPPADIDAIVKASRRGIWGWAGKATVDVVAHTFGFVVFALLAVKVPAVWPLASLVMPAFLFSLGYGFHVRKGTWAAPGRSTAAYVELEWRRKRGELRLQRFGRVLLAILAIGFGVWLPFFLATGNGRPELGLPFLIARLVFSVLTFVGTWLYLGHKVRKATAELDRLARVRASLTEDVPETAAI